MRPVAALLVLAVLVVGRAGGAEPPATVALFEDDAEGLLKLLTNPTGDPGEGHPEKSEVFSGTTSIKIIPMQRFSPAIEGWKHRITEKPKPGEYRFLRYAWKADGCAGVMLQLHDEKDWNIRYTSGQNVQGWGTKFVAPKPPEDRVHDEHPAEYFVRSRIVRQSCGSLARRLKLSRVYWGGRICVVHTPSRANETRTTIACGSTSTRTSSAASVGTVTRTTRERGTVRRATRPLPLSTYPRFRSIQRNNARASTALSASTVVST